MAHTYQFTGHYYLKMLSIVSRVMDNLQLLPYVTYLSNELSIVTLSECIPGPVNVSKELVGLYLLYSISSQSLGSVRTRT